MLNAISLAVCYTINVPQNIEVENTVPTNRAKAAASGGKKKSGFSIRPLISHSTYLITVTDLVRSNWSFNDRDLFKAKRHGESVLYLTEQVLTKMKVLNVLNGFNSEGKAILKALLS